MDSYNNYINEFINSENPNKHLIVNAYVARDAINNLDSYDNRKKHLEKLGYTLEKINEYQTKKQTDYINKYIENFYLDNNNDEDINYNSIIVHYHNSFDYQNVQKKIELKLSRFNVLNNLLEISKHNNYDFYNALSIEELNFLGW